MKDNKLDYAQKWFQLHNVPTFIHDNSIYLSDGHFEFELSEEEINYRAECYLNSEIQSLNN